MEENLSTVNAGQEVTVEPQIDVQDTGASTTEKVDSAPATQKPVQDPQTNAHFAEMRRKAEAAEARAAKLERDNQIARQYGQYGIFTEEDYQQALAEQEAQKMGVDPQFYQRFTSLEEKLAATEREKSLIEQDNNLKNDPVRGDLYKSWETEVKQLAGTAKVDYRTAFNYLLDQRLGDILNNQKTAGQQEAIKSITQNSQTSPGPLSDSGNTPYFTKDQVNKMSIEEINKNYSAVMASMKKWKG